MSSGVWNRAAVVTAFALAALSGCATEGKYERKVDSWLGADKDAVEQAWGQPDAVEPTRNSTHTMVYARVRRKPVSREQAKAGSGTAVADVYIKCATYFELDSSSRVIHTFFRGDECKSRD